LWKVFGSLSWALQLIAPHSHSSHRHGEGVIMLIDQINFVVSLLRVFVANVERLDERFGTM
jgi:hypothetical protein